MSFFYLNPAYPERTTFVGLNNWIHVLLSSKFHVILKRSLYFAFVCLTIEFFLGLGIATLLHKKFKGQRSAKTLILIPIMIAPVLVGYMWRFMFNAEVGVINQFLRSTKLFSPGSWLSGLNALYCIIAVDIWQWTPFVAIIILAGLQSLPVQIYEAARIDGASRWQMFCFLTIPLLQPVMFMAIVLRLCDLFRIFDVIYIMTQGGPGDITEILSIYAYKVAFRFSRFGLASTWSYIILFLTILLLIPMFKQTTRQF